MVKLVPANNPNNPQAKGNNEMNATNQTTANEANGSVMVNEFVQGETDIPVPTVDNPYTIEGGGNVYNVFYKHISYRIGAKDMYDAVDKGFFRMYNSIPNLKEKKSFLLSVQRLNNNRENHIYKYIVRKIPIKHPKHKYKVIYNRI